jgi:hypothetical protein
MRDRLMQDFEERSAMGRRYRGGRQGYHMPTYRSTAAGGKLFFKK